MKVLVHVDEIFLKGKNQGLFVRKLADNIRRLFRVSSVKRVEGGLVVAGLAEGEYERFSKLPGVAKFAPVYESSPDIREIKKCLDQIKIDPNAKTFRISANRSNKNFKMTSSEINAELGKYVEQKYNLKVSLKKHDLEIRVDITKNKAYVYDQTLNGAGGLPTGSSGKVLCLLSGGLDSPVAAYELMKRGVEVVLIHFQNENRTREDVAGKISDLAKQLSCYQPGIELHIVPFGIYQREIITKIPAAYRMIINRRTMFKIADKLARTFRCQAIATGDSLGQVASQTLSNLSAVYEASGLLKISPLITYNKNEVIKLARDLGTYDISNRPYPDCCSFMVAKHPKTKVDIETIKKMEDNLEIPLDKVDRISYHISIN